jgi:hypothetical protein
MPTSSPRNGFAVVARGAWPPGRANARPMTGSAMRLEGWQQGTDSRPSFETRVSVTQVCGTSVPHSRRYALLRMRGDSLLRKTNDGSWPPIVDDPDAPRVILAIE